MKLVSFQSFDALKELLDKGYLECDEAKIDLNKAGHIYNWMMKNMNKRIENKTNVKYPMWCWVRCRNSICPPKHKGKPVDGFDVKITFNKKKEDVFITDFRRYSFLLSNIYIPVSIKDRDIFRDKLKKYNISDDELKAYVRRDKYSSCRNDEIFLSVCKEIEDSFSRCITEDSDVLQGCVYRISLEEIESIEILNDKNYIYGSLNYVRSNGKRINWQEDFYSKLK